MRRQELCFTHNGLISKVTEEVVLSPGSQAEEGGGEGGAGPRRAEGLRVWRWGVADNPETH